VAKTANGTETHYTLDVAVGLVQVLVETTGEWSTVYLHGHDLLGEEGNVWTWHLNGGLGSPALSEVEGVHQLIGDSLRPPRFPETSEVLAFLGNRTAMTKTIASTVAFTHTHEYDDANRLTRVDDQAYTWDDNGNLLSDGTRTFTYDVANRLVQVVSGTITTTFAYPSVNSGRATATGAGCARWPTA
jgi:hypothetical protein